MSGAAGGTRIPRSAVDQTVKDFISNILSKIPGFKSAKISGSYNQPVKQDFGDIDLVVSIETDKDKKEVKKMIMDYFEGLTDKELPYLNSERYKGKKAINHGEIISNLYPISGMPGEFVQVDNIIAVSESEGNFKKVVLDYPAEIQGLILGLVKTPLLEEDPEQVLKRMGIKDVPTLGSDQEYEFHLDTSGLSLKIVTLDENYRQLDSNIIWESSDWNDVKRLLKDFNLDGTFEQFVEKIKKFKNPRSKNRVKGFFKTSIKVGSAEQGTPKGDGKQQALDTIAALQEKFGLFAIDLIKPLLLEQGEETIAIFPGKFKPPHKDHLARIQAAAKMASQVKVIIGPNPIAKNDEAAISAQEAMIIFDLYKKKNLVPDNVTFEISDIPSPVLKAYQEFENNPEQKYIAIFGKDDAERFKGIAKLPNVTVNNFPEANIGDASATDLRKAIAVQDIAAIKPFLPFGVSPSEYLDALNMPKKEPVQETYKGKRTDNGAPGTFKAKITKAYGGDVTIEKARKFKSRENATALDKQQANWFINFHSKNENLEPSDLKNNGKSAPYGSEYSVVQEGLAPYIKDLTKYMYNQGLSIDPAPEIEFVEDEDNAKNPLGKTAYYDPNNRVIVLYTTGRHPKDILRSFAHEMIHHVQNLEGRLGNIHTTNINEDDYLKSLEREAYERGNMSFRSWENSLRGDNGVRYIKGFAPGDHNDEPIIAEAKQVGTLYHYTSAAGLKNILQSNSIKASEETYMGQNLYYVSFTRNKNFHKKGSKFGVKTEYRITLDGDKLSNKYKIIPHAYKPGYDYTENWEYDWLEDEPENVVRDFFAATGEYDEQEERISFKGSEGGIDNIKNYILAVDKVEDLQENNLPRLNEGRYDSITNKLSKLAFAAFKDIHDRGDKKGTFSFIVGPKSEYEEEQPDIQSDEFEFDFNGIVVITKDLYVVDGGANAGFDNEGDEIQPVIELKFKIPKNPDWQKVSFDIKDVVRHELEHLTQDGLNLKGYVGIDDPRAQNDPKLTRLGKYMEDDQFFRDQIDMDLLPKANYFRLQKEIDAMLQGMYFKAKKSRQPFADVLNNYLDMQSISEEDKENILNLWRNRAKSLSLPKF